MPHLLASGLQKWLQCKHMHIPQVFKIGARRIGGMSAVRWILDSGGDQVSVALASSYFAMKNVSLLGAKVIP
jgi:hypothetical protein